MKRQNDIFNYMANKKNLGECGTGMVAAPQESKMNEITMKYRLADGRKRTNSTVVEEPAGRETLRKLIDRTMKSKLRMVDIEFPNGNMIYTCNKGNEGCEVTHWVFTDKEHGWNGEEQVLIPIGYPVEGLIELMLIAATKGVFAQGPEEVEAEENKWSKLYPKGKVALHWSASDCEPWTSEAEVVRTTDEFIEVRTDDSRIATNADGVVRVYWEACRCPEESVSLPLKFKDYMGVILEAADVEPEAEENDEDYNGFETKEKYETAKEAAEDIVGDCEVYWTDDWWDHERLKVVFADGSYDGEDCVYLDEDDFGHISVEVRAASTDLTWEVMDKIADLRAALKRGDFDEVFGVEEELPF